jgi:hypothetical protein
VWVVKVGLDVDQVAGFVEMVEQRLEAECNQIAVWVEERGEAQVR